MQSVMNPYVHARTKTDPQLAKWGKIVAEGYGAKLDDVNRVMTAQFLSPEDKVRRVRFAQMFNIAEGSAFQAKHALQGLAASMGINPATFAKQMVSGEALAGSTNQLADIVSYVTQVIHRQMNFWPRLLANELVSIQPLSQPEGNVFFYKHYDQNDRELTDIDLRDPTFTTDPGEGEEIVSKVKTKITSQHVEVEYEKLMHLETHEAIVKARTMFGGIELEQVNDSIMDEEMAQNIDRKVILGIQDHALQDYYFDPTAGGAYASMDEVNKAQYDETFLRIRYNQIETDFEHYVNRKPTWAIAGSEAATFLKRLRKFESRKQGGNYGDLVIGNGSTQYTGHIDDLNIWHDPQLDPCLVLIGCVEKMDPYRAGYIFCPFGGGGILTQAFMDPTNLTQRKAQAMAFAKVGVRRRQFAKLWIQHCS